MNCKTHCIVGMALIVSTLLLLSAAQGAISPGEREALIALYTSTNGDNWSNNSNWRKSPGVFNDVGTECAWHGVTCDDDESTVSGLRFLGNRLAGTIPPELGNLGNLQSLSLAINQLTGSIPSELGTLIYLEDLHLNNNQLAGSIPSELGNLTNLQTLFLQTNQLAGDIPPEFGNLAYLQFLFLDYNQLTGSVPRQLGNLGNLQSLDMGQNQLTETIPPELGNLAHLQSLQMEHNQLSGPIPPELGNLVNLEYFSLWGNQLTGSIPPELGNLLHLENLNLYSNRLTGSIPPELGNLLHLQQLTVSLNKLTGSIPLELGNLLHLENLNLYSNRLTGSIPPELGKLTNLLYLNLYNNQLTGPIPPELGNLANLERLDLGFNQLTGRIPPELGNPPYLEALYLNNNQFAGSIPSELSNLIFLEDLFLNNNQLTGPIPAELNNLANLDRASSWGLDLRFNHLFTDSNSLREFLNSRQRWGDWESHQTLHRYFAQFADGGGLFSQVVLFNLNDVSAASGQIDILGASGEGLNVDLNGETVVRTQEVSVPATGLLSLRTDGVGEVQAGSVRVTTDRHVEGVVIFGGQTGLAGVGSSPEFLSGFVAPMETSESLGINTGIAVTVLSEEEATLALMLLDQGGSAISQASETVAGEGHTALFVTEFQWDSPVEFSEFRGTLVVTASQPVTGTVLQTRLGEFSTLPVAPLQPVTNQGSAAEHRIYFAQFADGAGVLSSQILLLNLSDEEPAAVQITLRDNAGTPLTVDLEGEEVTGETQVEIDPRGLSVLATDGVGDLQVGSVTVASDQPLAGVILFAGPDVGAAGVGSSLELSEGFVAPMERNETSGINTGVAIMSLETEEMTVSADLLGDDGQVLASAQLPLAGLGHAALFVTQFDWDEPVDFSHFEGLLRVRATGSTAATVIQTRPGQFATMPVAAKPAD